MTLYVILRTTTTHDYGYGGWTNPPTYTTSTEVVGHVTTREHAVKVVRERNEAAMADFLKLSHQNRGRGPNEDIEYSWQSSEELY